MSIINLKAFIDEFPDAFQYVAQTEEMCLEALKLNPFIMDCIHKKTPAICKLAVQLDGNNIEFVEDPDEDLCVTAVTTCDTADTSALRFVKVQTPRICWAAIRHDPDALEYVKDQTIEMCLMVVKLRDYGLTYVHDQKEEICRAALESYPTKRTLSFIRCPVMRSKMEKEFGFAQLLLSKFNLSRINSDTNSYSGYNGRVESV